MSTDDEARSAARLTVLSGPSGAGRSSVVEAVRARLASVWVPVVATTRPPRPDERDGVDRVFLDAPAFDQLIAAGELLEWCRIGPYRRGVPRAEVRARLAAGRPVLLPLDLGGAQRGTGGGARRPACAARAAGVPGRPGRRGPLRPRRGTRPHRARRGGAGRIARFVLPGSGPTARGRRTRRRGL
ncbi:LOW QUALITY PROTEIN: guanylate kinase, partial [Micromonospora sp. M42]